MQRHGNNDIETLLARQCTRQQPSQRRSKRLDTAVFEQVDQLAEFVFIESERVRRVEPSHASAAQRAAPLIVQREAAQEGRAALYTRILRCKRFRLGQAGAANRYTRKISQGLIADPAIVGEKEGKKGSGDRSSLRTTTWEPTTAEDTPP